MQEQIFTSGADAAAGEAARDRPFARDRLRPQHTLRGALLLVLGLLLFACMDTTTKCLAARYDVPVIVAARYLGNFLLMILLLAPRHGTGLLETQRTGLVVVRAVALAGASLFM